MTDWNGETPQLRWRFWRGKTMFWLVIEETGRRHGQLESLGTVLRKAHFARGLRVMPLPAMFARGGDGMAVS